jgi:hypothetical protein
LRLLSLDILSDSLFLPRHLCGREEEENQPNQTPLSLAQSTKIQWQTCVVIEAPEERVQIAAAISKVLEVFVWI